ncbi:hypothetical protein [Phascolarctobacterium sp.]|uniref:hypothetical protein n=1 Tax=Phascolarctobacterium sp. TaxID=2049039 RepID=UPI003864276C
MADNYTQVKDITVNISTAAAAGSVGLGYPLVIEGMAEKAVDYTECSSIAEVVAAGFAAETEVYKACAAIFAQANKPKTVAVCASAGKVGDWLAENGNKGFRQVVPVLGADDSTIAELITAVSALDEKILFATVKSTDAMPEAKSERAVIVVYGGASEYPNAAVVGASAGMAAGSFTYKNLVIAGIAAENLSAAQVKAIHEAGGMCIIKKAGDIVTSEGKTTDGEYIDIVDSKDYIISNIVYQGQKMLNNSNKLPFDNVGISQLENVVTGVLADAYRNGIIASNEDGTPAYSTNFATRAEVPASDRAARTYNGGAFSFDLAGSIHNATINGTIEV